MLESVLPCFEGSRIGRFGRHGEGGGGECGVEFLEFAGVVVMFGTYMGESYGLVSRARVNV